MVSNRGNTPKHKKNSIAEELMALVSDEEYVEHIVCLTEDEYLTKTEVASLRKMISGKLWIDGRKFTNRQNQCIPMGMYKLLGSCVSKSAIAVHTELVTYFLEPEQKNLRDVLRQSAKNNKFPYSTWITNLNNINKPCDEYVLYLLCRCYNRHASIVTSKRILCTFKTGTMTLFEKLCKCDTVLIWLGESTYAEMKPLQTPKGIGPLQEWQLASECIMHLHEKNLTAKRPRKPISTTSSNLAIKQSSTTKSNKDVRQGTKRRRMDIDYKHYHNDGTVISRSPGSTKKPLPRASGPSAERLAAQTYITQEKRGIAVKLEPVASNRLTRVSRKLVKEEPDIHITHRKEKLMGPERVIHPSGKLCKTHNKGGYWDDELPDLDLPSASTTTRKATPGLKSPPRASRCSTRISSRLVATPVTCVASLLSGFFPEATTKSRSMTTSSTSSTNTRCTLPIPKTQEQSVAPSTSDVLSGYLLPVPVRDAATSRIVTTPNRIPNITSNTLTVQDTTSPAQLSANETEISTNIRSSITECGDTRVVTTEKADIMSPGRILPSPKTSQTRIVATKETEAGNETAIEITERHAPTEIGNLLSVDSDEMDLLEIKEAAERRSVLHDLLDDPTSRDVTTSEVGQFLSLDTDAPEGNAAESRLGTTSITSPLVNQTSIESQQDFTPPRKVATGQKVSDREPGDLEVAETLLQLHDTTSPEPPSDNKQLLPVDAPKQVDIIKEMEAEERTHPDSLPDLPHVYDTPKNQEDNDDDDDAATIIYEETVTPTRDNSSVTSPRRGQVTFKHYGIPRRSPKQSNIRKHRCLVCGKSKNSKKELNNHHRKEHSGVICPTCGKKFPTADSYQRHRYIHRDPIQHKCDICGKILPFESDLQRHLKSHTEENRWYCPHPPCKRNFKRKADLDLHEVIHTGVQHKCTWPGCKYSNLDPRNVKRHQKLHTQKATVQCPKCEKVFVFYMQMKRHRDQHH